MHGYIKIKAEIKIRLHLASKIRPIIRPYSLHYRVWNGCSCFAKRIVTITVLTDWACRKEAHFWNLRKTTNRQSHFLSEVRVWVMWQTPETRQIDVSHLVPPLLSLSESCCANFRSHYPKGHVSSRIKRGKKERKFWNKACLRRLNVKNKYIHT